jgi:hypothetical protein
MNAGEEEEEEEEEEELEERAASSAREYCAIAPAKSPAAKHAFPSVRPSSFIEERTLRFGFVMRDAGVDRNPGRRFSTSLYCIQPKIRGHL